MNGLDPLLRAGIISTPRLTLEPLGVHHAGEMTAVLAGTAIYRYIGGRAPTVEELSGRYAAQCVGASSDSGETWLNWIIRETGTAVGFVQATVVAEAEGPTSYIAWVVGEAYQGRGIAAEAANAMLRWLLPRTGGSAAACIHPENRASAAVARKLGLTPTGRVDDDGEERWEGGPPAPGTGTAP